jgi:hypothetical protein
MSIERYRIYGESKWIAQSGNALFAFFNKFGSGKKISVNSIEIYNNTRLGTMVTADTQSAMPSYFDIGFSANVYSGGETLSPAALDLNAATPTSLGILVTKSSPFDALTAPFLRSGVVKNFQAAWTLARNSKGVSKMNPGTLWTNSFHTDTTDIVINENQNLVCSNSTINASIPLYVTATIVIENISTTAKNTYQYLYFINCISELSAVFAIKNPASSGYRVFVKSISVSETGTYDTPYFRAVPISLLDANTIADIDKNITVVKLDTADANLSSNTAIVTTNACVLPAGVPVSYISESSVGSPIGFNYLNTKDFNGPNYAVFFPEQSAYKTAGTDLKPSTSGCQMSMIHSRIKGDQAPLVIRENEGFALVSSAETATGTTAVGVSGWGSYEFGMTITVEPATSPVLELTNLKANSEVKVLLTGTSTEFAGIESSGTSFQYIYEYSPGLAVDIVVLHMDWQYIRLTNIALTTTGVSIPIQQVTDRVYLNP